MDVNGLPNRSSGPFFPSWDLIDSALCWKFEWLIGPWHLLGKETRNQEINTNKRRILLKTFFPSVLGHVSSRLSTTTICQASRTCGWRAAFRHRGRGAGKGCSELRDHLPLGRVPPSDWNLDETHINLALWSSVFQIINSHHFFSWKDRPRVQATVEKWLQASTEIFRKLLDLVAGWCPVRAAFQSSSVQAWCGAKKRRIWWGRFLGIVLPGGWRLIYWQIQCLAVLLQLVCN